MSQFRFDFGPGATRCELSIGDVLCTEGEEGTDVFQIESGALHVERSTPDGSIVVATTKAGDIVGEITYALGGKRTATLRAIEPTTVTVVPYEVFIDWQAQHPEEASQLGAQARRRLNATRAASVLRSLFGRQHEELVAELVAEVSWKSLAPGEVLFRQGDEATEAYLVVAGRLHLLAHDPAGEVTLDKEIGRGELVGELGIIEDAPRSAGASAIRQTTVASSRGIAIDLSSCAQRNPTPPSATASAASSTC